MSNTLKKTANLTGDEKRALLARLLREKAGGHTREDFAHRRFGAQAALTPDAPAVADHAGRQLSYRQLDRRANRLARILRDRGAGPGSLVALAPDRSADLLVALLAVLKAGAAYLPLDPAYPPDRLEFMLRDSGATHLLTHEHLHGRLPEHADALLLDRLDLDRGPYDAPDDRLRPGDLAYVIYTSGSTGRPKGVMVPHHALANFLHAMRELLRPEPRDTLLAVTTPSFDIAALELLLPLTVGARVVLASRDDAADGARLADKLRDHDATLLQATPATWRLLLESGWQGQPGLALLCGGETLPRDLADRLLGRGRALWNLYGPTETTVWSAAARVRPGADAVPIGGPIANTRLYVVDPLMRPAPLGVAGELLIGGDGLARGYLGRPALTAERFVPDPFGPPGGRLYRTGDLARWRGDGQLECLGRLDHQVKVRGHRVELGEVEAALARHPGVRQAVAVARPDPSGENRLLAYVVPRGGSPPAVSELRRAVQEALPEPMVPSGFVFLESLPLTPNGKVDRKALPEPEPAPGGGHVPPRGPIEEALAAIWGEVLGLPRVGVRDSFFDLGGHSLLAARLVARVRDLFGVDLPISGLFEAPHVAGQARRVEEALRDRSGATAPPLQRVGRDGPIPASFAQQRLWFLDQLEPGSPLYNIALAIRVDGPLDAPVLERALNEVVRRHEALRTTFRAADGRPFQVIAPSLTIALPVTDLAGLLEDDRLSELDRLRDEEARRPFDLARGPLIRAGLLRLGEREHVVLLTMHHIISDGWSFGVLVREAGAIYEALARGGRPLLADLGVQYADYAAWQRGWLGGEALATQLDYWTRQLAGVRPLDLPTDRPRPPAARHLGGERSLLLPGALVEGLRSIARQEGATLFMTLLAAFQALLHRITGQDDVAVGSPVAGRTRSETEGLIGFFVNTLVLRGDLSGNPDFRALLGRLKQVVLEAFAHQDVPFEQLVEALQPGRDPGRSPLFQVMLVLQDDPLPPLAASGLTMSPLAERGGTSKFDLTLKVMEADGGMAAAFEYDADLFDAATIDLMLARLRTLLEGIVDDPDRPLDDLPLLPDDERRRVVAEWNGTAADLPGEGLIHRLFEARAARAPAAVAVVGAGCALTYAELDARANRLAHDLVDRGVGPDDLVGLCADRSPEMVVGMLGILKAGAAYLPLDPEYPRDRLAFMVDDSRAGLVLAETKLRDLLPVRDARVVLLDAEADRDAIAGRPDTPPAVATAPENLAYVIYTSGSAGRPKGVQVAHRNLVHSTHARILGYRRPVDRFLLLSSFGFDSSVAGLFWTLCQGGTLVLPPREAQGDPAAIADLVEEQRVSHLLCVPTLLGLVLAEAPAGKLASLNTVIVAGETCPRELPARLRSSVPEAELYNEYGPTEATVWSSVHRCDPGEVGPVPIGRPIANARTYVVDERLRPVPIGVPGELLIGGEGVARGYLDRPAITAERFLPDPFGGRPGGRLYRTGDLARWRPDGTLEFLGRLDGQVKVRGHRVEPGEVESALGRHPGVREAVAVVREDAPGDRRLVAYFVPANGSVPPASELRNWLKASLPGPMVPSAIMPIDALPLSPNGKVDRGALPRPDRAELTPEHAYEAPRTPAEEIVAATWAAVLGLARVGVRDDFFAMGGHSLLATQVVSRLRDAFSAEIPLRTLFESPTVAALARSVEAIRGAGRRRAATAIEAGPRGGSAPVSHAQQALWFLDRLAPGQPTFNVNASARVRGPLDLEALRLGFAEIVRRHDALRTTFALVDGEPVQVIAPSIEFPMEVRDLGGLPGPDREAEAVRLAGEESRRPFDLARGPLVRAVVLRLGDDDHVLLLTMHHIVTDGWSFGVAVRELAASYEAARGGDVPPLPDLPIQYADFARWQRATLRGEALEGLLGYWTRQLAAVPPLELPTDRPRPAVRAARGATRAFALPAGLTEKLEELGRREGATTFMVLLAAFQALLHRYSGQDDFAIGSPIANRNRAETEGLIGYFVNMLALRADLSGDPTFRALLRRVRETALAAYEHQDLSLDKLIEALQPPRDLSRTPLFQVMFVLQNNPLPDVGRQGLTLEPLLDGQGNGTAKFDITLAMEQHAGGGLAGGVEYDTELFDEATVARMLGHFHALLEAVAADPERRLSALPILDDAERRHLLVEASGARVRPAAQPACVHELFEAQAARTPDAEAIVSAGERLSYADLNRRSNRLARHLRTLGVGPEVPVAICATDPIGRMAAVLAVLKAGGAYLPLDPSLPRRRLASVLDDADAPLLLTEERLVARLPDHEALVVRLDADRDAWAAHAGDDLGPVATPANLAYVISTSGSLGKPKGVMVTHDSLAAAYRAWEDAYGLREAPTRHLQMASFAFDVFTGDWVRALASGGTLVSCPKEALLDPGALHELLVRERVDCAEFVPAVVENLIAHLEESGGSLAFLRLLAVGSDVWHAGEYERLVRQAGPATRVVSSYGLTEATIDSTYFEGSLAGRPAARPVPIGRPFAGTRVYVLDGHLEPVPVGVPGELHVGGPGLSRGYHGRPALTAEKFVPDPLGEAPGERLYKTGDLARWLPDGHLELVGRLDHQVKVRGFRIELAEVEGALLGQPGVREAVAALGEDKALVAYVVPRPGRTLSVEALRRSLQEVLPRPMIPSAFLVLDALPLTPSGKVDRNALPPIDRSKAARDGEALPPRDDLERRLVRIWEDLLGVRPVGIADNFFDLGGHSLLAVRLTARIEEQFGRKLPLSTLFLGATIEDLAASLRAGEDGGAWSPLVPIRPAGREAPFFCVHPIGGNVLCYHELARHLDPGRPFFGLQAAGIEGDRPAETRLEAMAARYVEAIREVQPEGPYHLGGWSLGGVVAFEIARQMRERGQEVATLILIDSRAPAGGERPSFSDEGIRAAFLLDLARATRGEVETEALVAEFGPERLARLESVFRANTHALSGYTPRAYDGRVVLVRAGGNLLGSLADPTLGWGALAVGGVATHVIPGDHYSLLKPPLVEELARIVEAELAGVREPLAPRPSRQVNPSPLPPGEG